MISKFFAKGIPKCSTCVYYRLNKESNIGSCIKFLGSHDKPIDAEIARYSDLMCGYNGFHHKSGEVMVVRQPDNLIFQPHI
jgi:hypothetical protein